MDSDGEEASALAMPAPWEPKPEDVAAPAQDAAEAVEPVGEDGGPAKKKKKATKAQMVESSKKKNKKYCILCPGCLLWFQPKDIAMGQRLDFVCKTYLDRIYYTAKVQGKLDWYGTVPCVRNKCTTPLSAEGRHLHPTPTFSSANFCPDSPQAIQTSYKFCFFSLHVRNQTFGPAYYHPPIAHYFASL